VSLLAVIREAEHAGLLSVEVEPLEVFILDLVVKPG
jgi:hypothetical protein